MKSYVFEIFDILSKVGITDLGLSRLMRCLLGVMTLARTNTYRSVCWESTFTNKRPIMSAPVPQSRQPHYKGAELLLNIMIYLLWKICSHFMTAYYIVTNSAIRLYNKTWCVHNNSRSHLAAKQNCVNGWTLDAILAVHYTGFCQRIIGIWW